MAAKKQKKRASGATITEDERAARGQRRVHVRLGPTGAAALDHVREGDERDPEVLQRALRVLAESQGFRWVP